MKKNNIKLNNIYIPAWLLWLFPITWIVSIPANLLLDLLVIVIAMLCLKIKNIKSKLKSIILKVWIFGFIADIIGIGLMYLLINLNPFRGNPELKEWWYSIQDIIITNPFDNIVAFLLVTVCVVATAVIIYLFNYKFSLKKSDLTNIERKKIALSLTIFTAPYLFYFPYFSLFHFVRLMFL